ncbi:MAG TPA: DUF4190 domain-containing protein [Iamia sp.]|nr:DUF4190 domain-containing protein [Iamia sp.]
MSYPPNPGAPGGYPPAGGYPPPGGYGQPGYGAAPASNGMAIAALILGIISLLGSLVPIVGWFMWPFALAAIGLGFAGASRAGKIGGVGKGMAVGGLITGALALLAAIAWTVILVVAADDVNDDFNDINTDPSNGVCDTDRILQDPDC